jgi:hypothetical protein
MRGECFAGRDQWVRWHKGMIKPGIGGQSEL